MQFVKRNPQDEIDSQAVMIAALQLEVVDVRAEVERLKRIVRTICREVPMTDERHDLILDALEEVEEGE